MKTSLESINNARKESKNLTDTIFHLLKLLQQTQVIRENLMLAGGSKTSI